MRQLVRYNAEAGVRVEGYLLGPAAGSGRNRRAGVVVLHPTSSLTIDLVAGVNGPEEQQVGLKLARRGLVVFCPRCFLWQDAGNFLEAMAHFKQRHPETLCMHKMLWDAMRGVDLLESLPQVDASRIGAVGHSLGAIESLYLAAFDERVRVAVASEAGLDFSFTNWHDPWFLGPAIRSPDFKLNHHQLLALTAPRAFPGACRRIGTPRGRRRSQLALHRSGLEGLPAVRFTGPPGDLQPREGTHLAAPGLPENGPVAGSVFESEKLSPARIQSPTGRSVSTPETQKKAYIRKTAAAQRTPAQNRSSRNLPASARTPAGAPVAFPMPTQKSARVQTAPSTAAAKGLSVSR